MQLMTSAAPGISAFPSADGNLLSWRATIAGPDDTPYAGLTFKLSFEFPSNYPYAPPTVLYMTPIYHPNVDFSGRICLDILKDKWTAAYNVQTVLLSLQSLLGEPNKYAHTRLVTPRPPLTRDQRISSQRRGCRAVGQGPGVVQDQGYGPPQGPGGGLSYSQARAAFAWGNRSLLMDDTRTGVGIPGV